MRPAPAPRRPPALPIPLPRIPWRRWLRRLRRSPAAWWLCAAAVAAFATARVGAIDDEAEAARAAWGEAVPVVVAVRAMPAGHVVAATDVVVESWPAAVVPEGALADVPRGRTVAMPVVAGEALVGDRVAPEGLSSVAALLPPGWRAVAVPAAGGGFGGDLPPLAVGDRVDVLAIADAAPFDPAGPDPAACAAADPGVVEGDCGPAGGGVAAGSAGHAGGASVVAAGALVVDVGDDVVTVAVPAGVAPAVVAATTGGSVSLALVGAA